MKLVQRFTSILSRLNRSLLESLLQLGMPRFGKRLVFVVSLYVGLNTASRAPFEALQALNDRLKVADNVLALELPAMASKAIWGTKAQRCVVGASESLGGRQCQEELSRVSAAILAVTPKWMRYAPPAEMLDDVEAVVSCHYS